ncbi:LysR family transcriptional regulator [Ferrimonas senticii]|uniref:LysR family transcriptional regulator n=1 Tax=Ferrimonas senticii TaxID=394566 RepID=UPI000421BDC3|nr:LysR family transcriptional regulator [Ferrimonas senticii]
MTDIHQLPTSSRLDLNLYRIFRAVAETGSTGAAAQQLHLTQSAVSHALARLRQQVGDPLLVKQGRGLVLTRFGREVLPQVATALDLLNRCQRSDNGFDPASSQLEFQLGFRDLLEALLLPPLAAKLQQLGATIRLRSQRVLGAQLQQQLLDGKLDLVVDIERPVSAQIASAPFRQEPLTLLLRDDHPLLAQPLTMSDYLAAQHVLVTLEPNERTFVEQRMQGLSATRKVTVSCESYFAAATVVANSDLLLTMPLGFAKQLQQLLPLQLRPLPFACEPLPVRLYWRRSHSDDPATRWLINTIRELALRV